jgi:hypothetical protein
MPSRKSNTQPFAVTDCAMLSIATGVSAQNLRELRDRLQTIQPGCIYYHFWGHHLRPGFEEPEYNNDFANWANQGLHDLRLAERLSVIDPSAFADLEALREELIDVVEERLDESEFVPWAKSEDAFRFIRSILVVFDTSIRVRTPKEMAEFLPQMSPSSLYYHFFDARRRTPDKVDDFRAWLDGLGPEFAGVSARIAEFDPSLITLTALRNELEDIFSGFLKGGSA